MFMDCVTIVKKFYLVNKSADEQLRKRDRRNEAHD
jgi:hypothetical protein